MSAARHVRLACFLSEVACQETSEGIDSTVATPQ